MDTVGITPAPGKPSIPDVVGGFADYLADHPVWGSLHVVLDDGNVRDEDVRFCLEHAETTGDAPGAELARTLLRMSRTQRLRLPGMADAELGRRAALAAVHGPG